MVKLENPQGLSMAALEAACMAGQFAVAEARKGRPVPEVKVTTTQEARS